MIGLGMIGLGVIAPYYLAAARQSPEVTIVAACDLDREALARVGDSVPVRTTHYRELLACSAVDAVVINTPNDLHSEICTAALRAGRDVCCEKPLAVSVSDADMVQRVATETGRRLFTAFHRRYNAHVRQLAAWTRTHAHACGGVVRWRVRYMERIEDHCGRDRWYLDPARSGGGCIADNGSNAFDLLEFVCGRLIVERAEIECDRAGADIRAAIELTSDEGVRAVVELDWRFPHGERKDVTVEFADGSTAHVDMLAGFPAFKSSLGHEYAGVIQDFGRALTGGRAVGGTTGPEVVALVESAYRLGNEVDAVRFDDD